MRMRALRWSAACLAGGVFVQSVQAQVGSLAGRVFTDSSAVPLAGVEVAIPSAQRSVRTDDRGAFRITGLAPGRYLVLVRMPGYVPVTDTVTIDFDTDVAKDYRLTATITTLDSVHVSATSPGLSARMRTFERRRAMGIGSFIPPEELRKKEEMTLRFVLARLPSLRFLTYKNATFAALARGIPSRNLPLAIPWELISPRQCWVQIYLDGIRIYAPVAETRGSSGAAQPVPNIEDFRVRDLEAIEFYSGPAQTPAELGGTGATCGTLVLWTRER
jgi:hypothetical protein